MLESVTTRLSLSQKLAIRRSVFRVRKACTDLLFSYGPSQLEATLRYVGLQAGDTVLMHSSFGPQNGFTAAPGAVIDTVLKVLGESGNLMMPSMPYRGSTREYLATGTLFDVRTSVSRMGILTELFRRRPGVERSLSATHPMLAFGPKARLLTADHERVEYPCGPDSPFEKALRLGGKVLLFDAPFRITFYHYVEHVFRHTLPVALYDPEPAECSVRTASGAVVQLKVRVFSRAARDIRDSSALERSLEKNNAMKTARVGNTRLCVVGLGDIVECARVRVASGQGLHGKGRRPIAR
jgi:aminoglycoside 3-N-acetyltransferase